LEFLVIAELGGPYLIAPASAHVSIP
jgi:hypothetical protein